MNFSESFVDKTLKVYIPDPKKVLSLSGEMISNQELKIKLQNYLKITPTEKIVAETVTSFSSFTCLLIILTMIVNIIKSSSLK